MDNKSIVIDGVDVSKCKLYRDEIHFVGREMYTDVCSIWIWQRDYRGLEPSCIMKCHCKDNPNCLFKQLKRKEQELENICKAFDIEYTIDEETGNLVGRCNKLYKKRTGMRGVARTTQSNQSFK